MGMVRSLLFLFPLLLFVFGLGSLLGLGAYHVSFFTYHLVKVIHQSTKFPKHDGGQCVPCILRLTVVACSASHEVPSLVHFLL